MFTRREMIPLFGMPLLTLLPTIDNLASEKKGSPKSNDKSLIVIWLGGGHASQETFAPTLDGPDTAKSTTGTVETNVQGIYLGGTFANLAKQADVFSLIHGLSHNDNNHNSASHFNMTGYMTIASDNAPTKYPSTGSIISSHFGSNSPINGIPRYVKASSISHDGPAFLGITNDGFNANDEGIKNLTLNIDNSRFSRRMDFIKIVEKSNQMEKNPLMGGWTELRGQAGKVIVGSAADAFRIEKEDDKIKDIYGVSKSDLGRQLLLARRLIQNGTKCVNVHFGNWDHHTNIKQNMENVGTQLDIYLSVLLEDLKQRGMLKDVMVVVTSEFSRTSLNKDFGRDHLSNAQTVLIAGGDFNHGRIIGEMTKDRIAPLSKAIHPLEIMTTILTHFGIPQTYTVIDQSKRPRHIIDGNYSSIL